MPDAARVEIGRGEIAWTAYPLGAEFVSLDLPVETAGRNIDGEHLEPDARGANIVG
jgi:hypothetical protein